MKNEFEKEYDPLADEYISKRQFFTSPKEEIMECLKEIGVSNKKVLDLGCGDGTHAKKIMELGADGVVGIDISSNFIDIAKQRNLGNCEFFVADGKEIPLPDNSVDIVFSNYVVHYFPNTNIVFSEVSRVLKPKGYFIATFNIAEVEVGFEYLYNQQMIIRLGNGKNSIIIHNLIKSREEIKKSIEDSGLVLVKEMEVDNPASVIDNADENKNHIIKHPTLVVLNKK